MTTEVTRFNPMNDFRNMQRLMDQFWLGVPRTFREDVDLTNAYTETLALDVYDKDNQLIVNAALPGVKPADIQVHVTDGVLHIKAETQSNEEVKDAHWHRREVRYGRFERSLRLPPDYDTTKATAKFDNGMLQLTFPPTPTAKARTVPIKVQ